MRLTVRTFIGPMELRRYESADRSVEALYDGSIVYLKPSFGLVRNDVPPATTPRPGRQARRLGAMWQRKEGRS